jgi:hypothetical protein
MPTNPITGLSTLTTYSTADLMEIVDVSDTTYAPTGTNKKVTFQNLLNLAGLPAGSSGQIQTNSAGAFGSVSSVAAGNVLTDNGSGVSPTFKAPVTSNYVYNLLTVAYTVTTTMTATGLAITLPGAGVWLIQAMVRCNVLLNGAVASNIYYQLQLWDATNSAQVSDALTVPFFFVAQVASANFRSQGTYPLGPFVYTASGPAIIQMRASYTTNGSPTVTPLIASGDGIGNTTMLAFRIS